MKKVLLAIAVAAAIPAHAAIVATVVARADGATISLTDEKNDLCSPWGGLRAFWTDGKETIEACYFVKNDVVRINYKDWDHDLIPLDKFLHPDPKKPEV